MTDETKPVLWVSCTDAGRGPQEVGGGSTPDQSSMAEIAEELEEQMGDRYEIVVADDKVRLLDADEVRSLLQDLTERAEQIAHEDALFEDATSEKGDDDGG